MLKGDNLIFIRAERVNGVKAETGREYDFGFITVSDGLESVKMSIEPSLVETQGIKSLKKGDKIKITVDVVERSNRLNFVVSNVEKGA